MARATGRHRFPAEVSPTGVAGGTAVLVGQAPVTGTRASGWLFTFAGGAMGNSTTLAINTVTVSPVFVPTATTVDRISLYINTGTATALYRLGLYADTGDIYPGELLFDAGTVDASTTGAKEVTLGAAEAIAAGVYWVAAKTEVAFTAARGTGGPVVGIVASANGQAADTVSGYSCLHAGAGFPEPFPTWGTASTATVAQTPRVGIRVTG
jgi:hypothetical protein